MVTVGTGWLRCEYGWSRPELNGDHGIPGAGVYKERNCSCVSLFNFNFDSEQLPDSVRENPTTKKHIIDMFSRYTPLSDFSHICMCHL